jgi:starch phosphorylase
VAVELFAESRDDRGIERHTLHRVRPLSGAAGGFLYAGEVPAGRPPGDYTPRVVPTHPEAEIPVEARFIAWYPA